MSAYADISGQAAEGVAVPGVKALRDIAEFAHAKILFKAEKITRGSDDFMTGAICQGSTRGAVRYLLAFTSTATNNTVVNVYDDVAGADAMLSRERLCFEMAHSSPQAAEGLWDVSEMRTVAVASGSKQVSCGGDGLFTFNHQACRECLLP